MMKIKQKYKFPNDFEFGAANWAQGSEGAIAEDGKAETVLETYAKMFPDRMKQNIGPQETLNMYYDNEQIIEMMKHIKIQSYRTSIMWSRLIPDGVNVNEKAVIFYREYFKRLRASNIKIWCTLYWFDMPTWLEDKGGFSSREVMDLFVEYCRTCFELFHEYIDIFYVYNEPQVDINYKYLWDRSYPFENDFNKAIRIQYNMLLLHAEVVSVFRELNITTSKIGSIINVNSTFSRSNNEKDVEAKQFVDLVYRDAWLIPLVHGVIPSELMHFWKQENIEIKITKKDLDKLKKYTVDCIGYNSYFPMRVQAKKYMLNPLAPRSFESYYDDYEMPGAKMNKDRGWEIYPRQVYEILTYNKDVLNNIECYITENGIGTQNEEQFKDVHGVIQDDYRIQYIHDHLEWVAKAQQDGCNIKGYHMWSVIDLWSPTNQFLNCYGLIEFNPITKLMQFKKSAMWYKKLIETHELEEKRQ